MQDELYSYVRTHDYESYIAALLTKDQQHRDLMMSIFALNYELQHIINITREPMTGFVRLAWWRDRIGDIYAGKPTEKHIALQAIDRFIKVKHPPKNMFDDVLNAYSNAVETKKMPLKNKLLQPLIEVAEGKLQGKTLGFLERMENARVNSPAIKQRCRAFLLPWRALWFDLLN